MVRLIVYTLYLLTVFVPLVFTTINFELFEFPKFIILLSGTLVITLAWAYHVYQTGDKTIVRPNAPPWLRLVHWSMLAVLVTQLLSTLFSIHPYTSFWGYYSRFHQGLLSTVCYTLVYFAAVRWLDRSSALRLIKLSVLTAIVVSLYGILEHFGIDQNLWVQDVKNRVFSTLGQPNWLAAYLVPNIFLIFYLFRHQKFSPFYSYLGVAMIFTALMYTKSRSGFLAFGFAYLAYWLLHLRTASFRTLLPAWLRLTAVFLGLALFLGTPFSRPISALFTQPVAPVTAPATTGTVLESGGTESGVIRRIVWEGAFRLIRRYPVLGTGPETFAYTYYWERPLAHNYTSEWDYLYNKAHNEYLNSAATVGLLGLAAYLFWHGAVLYMSLTKFPTTKKADKTAETSLANYFPVLAAVILSFAITNFFGFSVIPVYLLTVLLVALPTALARPPDTPSPAIINPAIPLLTIGIALIWPARLYLADYYFTRGKVSGSIPLLETAVKFRPQEPLFHSYLAEAYAVTPETGDYTQRALAETALTRKLNPYHLNYHKSRAKVYLSLVTQNPDYHIQAAEELIQARKLAPSDPKLAYNLGLVYSRIGDIDKAESEMRQAIELKKDYQDAYYALTLIFEQTGNEAKIPELLRTAQGNLATYSGLLQEKMDLHLKP